MTNPETKPQLDPGRALKRLGELAGQAGPNIFERIQLSFGLLTNDQWVESKHKGDFAAAEDELEKKYFQDISGLLSLWRLHEIFREFPLEEPWRENGYNLKVMYALWKKKTGGTKPGGSDGRMRSGPISAESHRRVQEELKEAQDKLEKNRKVRVEQKQRIEELEKEVNQLRIENAELRGRILALESVVDGKRFVGPKAG